MSGPAAAERPTRAAATPDPQPHRLDDLVHALSQLPDEFTLEIECDESARRRLALIVGAYGIGSRVLLEPSGTARWRMAAATGDGTVREVASDGSPPAGTTIAELIDAIAPRAFAPPLEFDDDLLEGHRLAFVTNVPARYRVDLFNAFGERLESCGAKLRVVYLARPPARRSWLRPGALEFEHEYLRSVPVPVRRRPPYVPVDLGRTLRRFDPTIVISAGFSPMASGWAARYARSAGASFGLYSGEIASVPTARSRLRAAQRRRMIERADFGLAYSQLGSHYLAGFDPALPMVVGRNTSVASAGPSPGSGSQTVRLLTVADLSSAFKGVDVLVEALLLRPDLDCRLTIVGDGADRPRLERIAGGDPRIEFAGALWGDELHALRARSDGFLFASRADRFGLVQVEAMASGLATVVSAAVGAVPDLAAPGGNCLVVQTHEPADWAAAIARLVEDAPLRASLADAAWRTIAQRWTFAHAAAAMTAGTRLGALVAPR